MIAFVKGKRKKSTGKLKLLFVTKPILLPLPVDSMISIHPLVTFVKQEKGFYRRVVP
jgi:hypothetical protein